MISTETTLCWNCSMAYEAKANQCPGCCATNANLDLESAQIEMADKSKIDHDLKFIRDWQGDPNVINGTDDCSFYRCRKCGHEEIGDLYDYEPEPDDVI